MSGVLSNDQFHANTLADGGATRKAVNGREVPAGSRAYGVGGAKNDEGKEFPEHPALAPEDFTPDVVGEHLSAIRKHFGDHNTSVHQGAWVEDGKVVLDATDVYKTKKKATDEGSSRNQRAIYDFKNAKDINLAGR